MGTMRERKPGVWQLRVSAGFDAIDGRRRVVTETFTGSERAASRRLAEMETDARRGARDAASINLRYAVTAWRAATTHKPGTSRNYDTALKAIPAKILDTPIDKLRAATLRELEERVVAQHGIHRARGVHAVVSGALTYAWRQEWIADNIARRVTPPAQPKRKDTTPSTSEVRRLLLLVDGQPEVAAWMRLLAVLGSRRSEVLALRWPAVDLERGQVKIEAALEPVTGVDGDVKADGDRVIAIGAPTVAALRRWRTAYLERALSVGVTPLPDGYVFCRDPFDGSIAWRPDYATKKFRKLCDEAARYDDNGVLLPADAPDRPIKARQHDLRHYVATELLAAGVPLKSVSGRMGHSRTATTADLYAMAMPAVDQESAALLEERLR